MRVCLVSREVAPFGGGGVGRYVSALARVLSRIAEVTVVTLGEHAAAHAELVRAGSPELPPGVRFEFVAPPDRRLVESCVGYHHAWSVAVLEHVRALYGDSGPDLLEVPDYHAEGFALVQAKRSRIPELARTRILVRAHTSWEMCSLLDGHLARSRDERAICAMERYVLRYADLLLWAGGDILGTYERFYGADRLAPALRVRHPLPAVEPARSAPEDPDAPLRVAYVGRMERRKGVLDVVRGFARNPGDDWRLTLIGGDTDSGPAGTSMQATLELMTLGDERFAFAGALPRDETLAAIAAHDLVVMPSRWECWPYSVLEAMQAGRPVLATGVGGHVELVADGTTGWLVAPGEAALGDALARLLERRADVRALSRSGAPERRCAELCDDEEIAAAYAALPAPVPARRPRTRRPLVSAVIPCDRAGGSAGDAVAAISAQTYPNIEIVVVDDGALLPADALESSRRLRVLHQPNRGPGGARNAGIEQSEGRYVFPLDVDVLAEPEFVERCVALLEDDHRLAYVTSWTRFVDAADAAAGRRPLGNTDAMVEDHDVAGDAAAVWPRRHFDLGFRYSEHVPAVEGWTLYRRLWRAGRYGHVIPEPLLRRRVRGDAASPSEAGDVDNLRAMATAELRLEEFRWTPPGR